MKHDHLIGILYHSKESRVYMQIECKLFDKIFTFLCLTGFD